MFVSVKSMYAFLMYLAVRSSRTRPLIDRVQECSKVVLVRIDSKSQRTAWFSHRLFSMTVLAGKSTLRSLCGPSASIARSKLRPPPFE